MDDDPNDRTGPPTRGPIEDGPWPQVLTTRVGSGGAEPRIHGYAVDDDLAVHYGAAERTYLCLTGELPEDDGWTGRVLDVSLGFASALSAGDGPAWTAVTARLTGGHDGGWMAAGSIALLEEARAWSVRLESLSRLPRWTWRAASASGHVLQPEDGEGAHRAGVYRRTMERLGVGERAPEGLPEDWGLEPTLVWTWCGLGLTQPRHWTALWFWARWPTMVAEAGRLKPGAFRSYPMNVPRFEYEEP